MTNLFLICILISLLFSIKNFFFANITADEDLLHINWTEFQKHPVLNSSQQNNRLNGFVIRDLLWGKETAGVSAIPEKWSEY